MRAIKLVRKKDIWTILCPKQKTKLIALIIILCLGCIGWTTFAFLFPPMYQESEKVWQDYQTRQLNNGIGESVGEVLPSAVLSREMINSLSSTESHVPTSTDEVQYVASRGGLQTSAPVGGVERIIYDIFGEEQYKMALAVAKAESRLDPKATNVNSNGSRDYGLFQCNSVHNPTEKEKTDPKANTELAKKIWEKSGWQAWSVVKSKKYLAFYNQ